MTVHREMATSGSGKNQKAKVKLKARSASVVSYSICEVLIIDAVTYHKHVISNNVAIARVPRALRILATPPEDRTRENLIDLMSLAEKNKFLSQLSRGKRIEICKVMRLKSVEQGEIICLQGSKAKNMYIVLAGSVFVRIKSSYSESKMTTQESGNELRKIRARQRRKSLMKRAVAKAAVKGRAGRINLKDAARAALRTKSVWDWKNPGDVLGPVIAKLGIGDAFG